MKIKTYTHKLTTFAGGAALAGVLAIAVPAMASASQFTAADSPSIAAPMSADDGPIKLPKVCCYKWICWLC